MPKHPTPKIPRRLSDRDRRETAKRNLSSSVVITHHPLRNATWFVRIFVFHRDAESDFNSIGQLFQRQKSNASPNLRLTANWRREAHTIQSIVHSHAHTASTL